ncbi:MAG: hypothetical protein ACM3XM_08775 [Mycobacterium leprae]
MGHVVPFPPRNDQSVAKTEEMLNKIGQAYQRKLKAKDELPRVLAQLIAAGETELVLQAVTLWGEGRMEPYEVLELCEKVAAVAGIHPVGDRPL